MEKTINILRQEAVINAEKVAELTKRMTDESLNLDKRLEKMELFHEDIKIQVEEITECVTILTNRRSLKLEKDCARRLKRKQDIRNTLSGEKKKLRSSN
jgi:hypothetical protein